MSNIVAERIEHLARLGQVLQKPETLDEAIAIGASSNVWFVEEFVRNAINMICHEMLNEEALTKWVAEYNITHRIDKTIGIIMAGNIPLVGFHDFLCGYVCGCKIKLKLSGKDDRLLPYILQLLSDIDDSLKDRVQIIEKLDGYDAVIATGSNNSNRYFEYYFRQYPKVLRRNRNSVAIISGDETAEDLTALADDVFMYFGFGCRNVSKIYVPVDYDITQLFPHFEKYKWFHHHNKYMNNYDYNRSILLLNSSPHLANEFVMLQEHNSLSSPIAMLHYERYKDEEQLKSIIKNEQPNIQSIVDGERGLKFGESQKPSLSDYADGVDIVKFILSLKTITQ